MPSLFFICTPAVLGLLFSLGIGGRSKPAPVESIQLPPRTMSASPVAIPVAVPSRSHRLLHDSMHGIASWYGGIFQGRKTASGEIYDENQFTACHHTLPFGTRVRVTNLTNGRSVIVRINDRGTLEPGRIIDLSEAAAAKLHMVNAGLAQVRLETLDTPNPMILATNTAPMPLR